MHSKLHIGSGKASLPGWINIDSQAFPGVDRVLDVRHGLPFENVQAIFAEHFIEHLTLPESMAFLEECRRALAPEGRIRISTPNLDWVWVSHYLPPAELTDEQALQGCLELNRAFHGWGHRFLYNYTTLDAMLRAAGFTEIVRCSFHASAVPEFRNLEQHEYSPAFDGVDSLLSVEASGRSPERRDLSGVFEPYLQDLALER